MTKEPHFTPSVSEAAFIVHRGLLSSLIFRAKIFLTKIFLTKILLTKVFPTKWTVSFGLTSLVCKGKLGENSNDGFQSLGSAPLVELIQTSDICVREHLPKKMFSFGHCPNEGGGGPCPN